MNARDQRILLEAGFSLFRLDLTGKRISKCKSPGGWTLRSKHETQKETKLAWGELMKDETNLTG